MSLHFAWLPTRGWLIGCSAHLTLITANKNYQIPDSTKGFAPNRDKALDHQFSCKTSLQPIANAMKH